MADFSTLPSLLNMGRTPKSKEDDPRAWIREEHLPQATASTQKPTRSSDEEPEESDGVGQE
ncbi:hypothetical protein Taro_039289 [Colocasia esculenta]|uniref:Uncharacterized protein n=1 Tax=Colocasia esculenta TaxID=4460 RepID=A0A843WG94_COLES|nr:hypothetical protein [Colocasia esculenta]